MAINLNAHVTPEPIQEFTDKAIDDPEQMQKLAQRLRRPRWQLRFLWLVLVVAAVALLAGVMLGRFMS